jgi:hypothetical protein
LFVDFMLIAHPRRFRVATGSTDEQ